MPRQRDIVAGKVDEEQLKASSIRRIIETFEPYRVLRNVVAEAEGDDRFWAVVYDHPRTQERSLIGHFRTKVIANRLKGRLENAWAEGVYFQRD